ncbi:MAG: hypothetical protein Q8R60_01950 [Mycobacteriales bacterium]|nr:hypothetical protein [Mycobacteriales bacterium]
MADDRDIAELRALAHRTVMDGVAADDELGPITYRGEAAHVRGRYTPDVAMLEVVAAAVAAAGVSAATPVDTGLWVRSHLPEVKRSSRDADRASQMVHIVLAYAAGVRVDVLEHTYHWHGARLRAATAAAVMTLRALSEGRDRAQLCTDVAGHLPDFH